MKEPLLVLIMLILTFSCYGQQMSVGGEVRNMQSGEYIDFAEVKIYQEKREISKVSSNSVGVYFTEIREEGDYTVKVGAEGFSEIIYEISVLNGDSLWIGESLLSPPAFECVEEVEMVE